MKKYTIMLVCSAGMSTSMLVARMQKSAEKEGIDAKIFAVSANDADRHLASEEIDVLMLGPQVKFMKSNFDKKVEGKNINVDVIDMQDYGMMNGEKVLQRAIDLIT